MKKKGYVRLEVQIDKIWHKKFGEKPQAIFSTIICCIYFNETNI